MDAGFWSRKVITACADHKVQFSITVTRQPIVTRAMEQIPDEDWVDIAVTDSGVAQVAEASPAGTGGG
jgi:hypothetical protein